MRRPLQESEVLGTGRCVYGIGYPEQTRVYVGTIRVGNALHTLFVVLDAEDHARLARSPRRPDRSSRRFACRQASPGPRRSPH
jgi:hypothetical protein